MAATPAAAEGWLGLVQQPPTGSARARVDIEAAVAALKDGRVSQQNTVEAMEALLLAREAALRTAVRAETGEQLATMQATLEARFGGGPAWPAEAATRKIVARLTATPPNLHQATVYFADADQHHDERKASRWLLLCGSALLVFGQCVAAVGVAIGTIEPACSSSAHCSEGAYCRLGGTDRCTYCGDDLPLPLQTNVTTGVTLNLSPNVPEFSGFNATLVAEVCLAAPVDRVAVDWFTGMEQSFDHLAVASWSTPGARPAPAHCRRWAYR